MRTPRTFKDLKEDPRVQEIYREEDNGIWIHLKPGWWSMDMECGIIHEGTVNECCRQMGSVIRGRYLAGETLPPKGYRQHIKAKTKGKQ